jgi:thioredoxin-like negative regulator of GroEL
MALLKTGEKAEALTILSDARREADGDPTIRFHYAQALVENGREDRAIAVLETLLQDTETFREREDAEQLLATLTP